MKTVELKVAHRENLGKGHARRIRRENRIPAILYGSKLAPVALSVDLKEFKKVLKTGAGENVILTLKIDGLKKDSEHTARIKDIQVDPVTDAFSHVDFNAISLTEKIRVQVPVHAKGEAPGVKEGGVLEHIHREVEVECLPTQIPEKFEVVVDQMKIGDSVHVRELAMPEGVVSTMDPDEVILALHAPMKEEVAAPAEGEAPSEPEVIGKKKEEGEAVPEAAEKEKGGEKK
ncbi:MAG: 50S ribosomal protein L25/general stress protein Ctc [Candidatus Omnitrophica bacterium]|nr:50S ribosomal protein L25/general stress protein Ctc [Candidatus Omnitrophota bacterium]